MRLYHFTDAWAAIEASGLIENRWPTELSVPYTVRLIHLSASADIKILPESKRHQTVRIAVDLPDEEIIEWMPWVRAIDPEGAWSLSDKPRLLAGRWVHDGDDSQWYVIARPIPRREWHGVVDTTTGATLWES